MTKQEKHDQLIMEIEKHVQDPYIDAGKIAEKIAQKNGYTLRELNTIFQYMSGNTTLEYIKERKMMLTGEYLISDKYKSLEEATTISGSSDLQTFSKKFKKYFGITPTEALADKAKLKEQLKEPETWEIASRNDHMTFRKIETIQNNLGTIFGIPKSQYDKVIEAQELSALYGFNIHLSNLAFEFSEKQNISLKDVFEYFDGIRSYAEELEMDFYDFDKFNITNYIKEKYKCSDIQYLYFKRNFKINIAIKTVDQIRLDFKKEELDITKLDIKLLETFAEKDNISFKVYKDIFEYYQKNTNNSYDDLNFEEYFRSIIQGNTKENALFDIIPGAEFNSIEISPYDNLDQYDDFDFLERTAREEEEWNRENLLWDYDENDPERFNYEDNET